jgi:hypothetical protein
MASNIRGRNLSGYASFARVAKAAIHTTELDIVEN